MGQRYGPPQKWFLFLPVAALSTWSACLSLFPPSKTPKTPAAVQGEVAPRAVIGTDQARHDPEPEALLRAAWPAISAGAPKFLKRTTTICKSFGCGSKPMVPSWGRCTTHFGLFSGDWDVHWRYGLDVHWGYGLLTYGHLGVCCFRYRLANGGFPFGFPLYKSGTLKKRQGRYVRVAAGL